MVAPDVAVPRARVPHPATQALRAVLAALLSAPLPVAAQVDAPPPTYQTDFPPEEFRARWGRIFEGIGPEAAALVQGGPMVRGFQLPRQTNEFYYLCGVETPHSYLYLDGRTRKTTLFLPPRNARLERSEGRVLSADDAALLKGRVGVDEVLSTDALRGEGLQALPGGLPSVLFTPFSPGEGFTEQRHEIQQANAAIATRPLRRTHPSRGPARGAAPRAPPAHGGPRPHPHPRRACAR